MTQLSLPGDRWSQDAVDWGKQNIADLTQTARTCRSAGPTRASSSRPLGHRRRRRWIGAGFPDYPWIFGTDAEYTAFAAVAVGQFEAIKDHLRALRDVSDILNDRSGVVTHEVVSDGSIWFGQDSRRPTRRHHDVRLQHRRDGQVPQHRGADLALDRRQPVPRRDVRLRRAQPALRRRNLDADHDGWPEGLGNVERGGMGPEKLDNTVYFIRGLYDLADMARSKHDGATFAWANNLARQSCAALRRHVVDAAARRSTPTRSTTPATCSRSRSTGSARRRWRPS